MDREQEYRAMLAVDIERSSGRGNVPLLEIRHVLSTTLRAAFAETGIDWDACVCDDLGDGLRVVAPAAVAKRRLIHPLIPEFVVRLRAHNRMAGPPTQVRVRMALHAGEVHFGPAGAVAGRPLEVLARLLDAPPSRNALAQAPPETPAVLLISQHFYDETVGHGYPGIDKEMFRKVHVVEKNYTADAWLFLPDSAAAPQDSVSDRGAGAEPAAGGSTMVNNASGSGVVYAAQNGPQIIHTDPRS